MNSTHDTKEPTSFAHLTKEVVRTFLETAVVLDDGAFMSPPTVVEDVNEPNTNSDSGDPDSDSDATPIADSDDQPSNSLDAQALMTNFATHGMVCSVLAPWKDDDGTHPTVNVSRRADIVILDWELEDDQGEQATRIIREILDHDASAGGRLRLIAVYTAHQRLDPIRDAVANHLPAFVPHDRTATARSLETDHARVVFIKKGPTSTVSGSVLEPDLPGRLVDDFVDMARGLLANVAFGCIAALRAHTHQLLARFPARLDGPYLSHRILLKTPEDAEQYAVDLLNSEITELLRHGPIASTYAGNSAIRLTLSQAIADGTQPRLMLAKNADTDTKPLSLDDVMKLVEQGPPGLGGIDGLTANRSQMENLHHKVDLLLAPDLASGRAAHHDFARLSSHARERVRAPAGYRAKLDLGSILRHGDDYLLCIQPRCDALRLSGKTQFVFATFSPDSSKFDIVVKEHDGTDVLLRLNTKATEIRSYAFLPDVDTGSVMSSNTATFESHCKQIFTWICDLRDSIAQRCVHHIANNLSRIALEEFEWQRLHAPKR